MDMRILQRFIPTDATVLDNMTWNSLILKNQNNFAENVLFGLQLREELFRKHQTLGGRVYSVEQWVGKRIDGDDVGIDIVRKFIEAYNSAARPRANVTIAQIDLENAAAAGQF
jgi:hypothetical protein